MFFNCALLNSKVPLVNVISVCGGEGEDVSKIMAMNWFWQYIFYLQINPTSFPLYFSRIPMASQHCGET